MDGGTRDSSLGSELSRDDLSAAADSCTSLPGDVLVDIALRVAGSDAALAEGALAALLRRTATAEADRLVVAGRPHEGAFGVYSVRPRRGDARPYATVLRSISPVIGSCGCPDFARASLGLCKHLVTVVADLHRKPRTLERALHEQILHPVEPRVTWDPVRPLVGPGDWLERVVVAERDRTRASLAGMVASTGRLTPRTLRQLPWRARAVDALMRLARADAWDPALLGLLERERARGAMLSDGEMLARRYRSLGRSLLRAPYPFQVEGIRRFLRSGRMLLADDMGLGKTTQAIAACHALFEAGRVKRGLIITPASLKLQWLREWEQTSSVPARVVDGPRRERERMYSDLAPGFLIINYEQLLRDLELAVAYAPDIVVLDEAQRIKNWETKTAIAVKSLSPTYRLVLTGTPLENRLDELASILDWVDDMALEPKWRLGPWHTFDDVAAEGGGRGVRNLETIRTRIAPVMTRRTRRGVLTELPSRTDTRVPVDFTRAQAEAHRDLEPAVARLAAILQRRGLRQEEFTRLMSLLAAQRMICNGMALARFGEAWPTCEQTTPSDAACEALASPKLVELRRLISDLAVGQGRKIAVFSQWRRMLRLGAWATSDILAAAGVRAAFFTGSESQKERDRNVRLFHDDPDVRVLFLTDAGGVGLNLQRAATACINLELPWNPAVLEQRIGRIHRLGQESPIDVYNLVSEAGIEARIASLVADKRQVFDALFDGTSDQVTFASSTRFGDRLAQIVDVEALADEGTEAPALSATELGLAGGVALGETDDDAPAAGPAEEAPAAGPLPVPSAVSPPDVAGLAGPEPTGPEPTGPEPTVAGEETRDQGGAISVERTATGVTVHAPPEVADLLATVFEKLAQALRRPA